MQCPKCNATNEPNANICRECRQTLSQILAFSIDDLLKSTELPSWKVFDQPAPKPKSNQPFRPNQFLKYDPEGNYGSARLATPYKATNPIPQTPLEPIAENYVFPEKAGYLVYRDNYDGFEIRKSATIIEQMWAGLIDNYLFGMVSLYVGFAGLIFGWANGWLSGVWASWWLISLFWVILYFTVNLLGVMLGGQTFGQNRLDIRVAMKNGKKPTLTAALIRTGWSAVFIYWLTLFSYLPFPIYFIGFVPFIASYLLVPFDRYRRTAQDLFARTYLISTTKEYD
jgi:uncharacterized RDD family membrane protein YckC